MCLSSKLASCWTKYNLSVVFLARHTSSYGGLGQSEGLRETGVACKERRVPQSVLAGGSCEARVSS